MLTTGDVSRRRLDNWRGARTIAERVGSLARLRPDELPAVAKQIADVIVLMLSERAAWLHGVELPVDGRKLL